MHVIAAIAGVTQRTPHDHRRSHMTTSMGVQCASPPAGTSYATALTVTARTCNRRRVAVGRLSSRPRRQRRTARRCRLVEPRARAHDMQRDGRRGVDTPTQVSTPDARVAVRRLQGTQMAVAVTAALTPTAQRDGATPRAGPSHRRHERRTASPASWSSVWHQTHTTARDAWAWASISLEPEIDA
jgi:hypothetical protein